MLARYEDRSTYEGLYFPRDWLLYILNACCAVNRQMPDRTICRLLCLVFLCFFPLYTWTNRLQGTTSVSSLNRDAISSWNTCINPPRDVHVDMMRRHGAVCPKLVLKDAGATGSGTHQGVSKADVCDMRRECERRSRAETHIERFRNHEIFPFTILYKKYCTRSQWAPSECEEK